MPLQTSFKAFEIPVNSSDVKDTRYRCLVLRIRFIMLLARHPLIGSGDLSGLIGWEVKLRKQLRVGFGGQPQPGKGPGHFPEDTNALLAGEVSIRLNHP